MSGVSQKKNPRGHRVIQEWLKGTQMITCLNCDNSHVSRRNFAEYDCANSDGLREEGSA